MLFEVSTKRLRAPFAGAKRELGTSRVDFEDGGVALNDTSKGLRYQVWRADIQARARIELTALTTKQKETVYTATGDRVTDISFTFDGNMNPILAFVEDGVPKIKWYDSSEQAMVVTDLAEGVKSPKVFNDEKRQYFQSDAEVLLVYIRDKALYYRLFRERFTIERLIANDITTDTIDKVAMLTNYRVGIALREK